jgi:hypothetical protein
MSAPIAEDWSAQHNTIMEVILLRSYKERRGAGGHNFSFAKAIAGCVVDSQFETATQ